jgi:hypothetical protein
MIGKYVGIKIEKRRCCDICVIENSAHLKSYKDA